MLGMRQLTLPSVQFLVDWQGEVSAALEPLASCIHILEKHRSQEKSSVQKEVDAHGPHATHLGHGLLRVDSRIQRFVHFGPEASNLLKATLNFPALQTKHFDQFRQSVQGVDGSDLVVNILLDALATSTWYLVRFYDQGHTRPFDILWMRAYTMVLMELPWEQQCKEQAHLFEIDSARALIRMVRAGEVGNDLEICIN